MTIYKAEENPPPETRKEIGLVDLPEEAILCLRVNQRLLTKLSCTPLNLRELIIGWLFTQGLIDTAADITGYRLGETSLQAHVRLNKELAPRLERYQPAATTACSGGEVNLELEKQLTPIRRHYPLETGQLIAMMKRIFPAGRLFLRHGGIHCALLADMRNQAMLTAIEDLGRSNAVDKVIGWGLLNGVDFSSTALFTTGRISAEMVLKTVRAGIPCLVSLTTLTSRALDIARKTGITIAGHILKPRPILINF